MLIIIRVRLIETVKLRRNLVLRGAGIKVLQCNLSASAMLQRAPHSLAATSCTTMAISYDAVSAAVPLLKPASLLSAALVPLQLAGRITRKVLLHQACNKGLVTRASLVATSYGVRSAVVIRISPLEGLHSHALAHRLLHIVVTVHVVSYIGAVHGSSNFFGAACIPTAAVRSCPAPSGKQIGKLRRHPHSLLATLA